jgi:hypothetical protein
VCYRLRTLLILLAVLPPVIAMQYRKWQDGQIWQAHHAAMQRRNDALMAWRIAYEASQNGQSAAFLKKEKEAQRQYDDAKQDVEITRQAIYARYGKSERELSAGNAVPPEKVTFHVPLHDPRRALASSSAAAIGARSVQMSDPAPSVGTSHC